MMEHEDYIQLQSDETRRKTQAIDTINRSNKCQNAQQCKKDKINNNYNLNQTNLNMVNQLNTEKQYNQEQRILKKNQKILSSFSSPVVFIDHNEKKDMGVNNHILKMPKDKGIVQNFQLKQGQEGIQNVIYKGNNKLTMIREGTTAFLYDESQFQFNGLLAEEYYQGSGNEPAINKPHAIIIESSPFGPIEYLSDDTFEEEFFEPNQDIYYSSNGVAQSTISLPKPPLMQEQGYTTFNTTTLTQQNSDMLFIQNYSIVIIPVLLLIIGFFAKMNWDKSQAMESLEQRYNEAIKKHQEEKVDGDNSRIESEKVNQHRRSHTNELRLSPQLQRYKTQQKRSLSIKTTSEQAGSDDFENGSYLNGMNNYKLTGSFDNMDKINEEPHNLESPGANTNKPFPSHWAAALSPEEILEDENNDQFTLSAKPVQYHCQTQRTQNSRIIQQDRKRINSTDDRNYFTTKVLYNSTNSQDSEKDAIEMLPNSMKRKSRISSGPMSADQYQNRANLQRSQLSSKIQNIGQQLDSLQSSKTGEESPRYGPHIIDVVATDIYIKNNSYHSKDSNASVSCKSQDSDQFIHITENKQKKAKNGVVQFPRKNIFDSSTRPDKAKAYVKREEIYTPIPKVGKRLDKTQDSTQLQIVPYHNSVFTNQNDVRILALSDLASSEDSIKDKNLNDHWPPRAEKKYKQKNKIFDFDIDKRQDDYYAEKLINIAPDNIRVNLSKIEINEKHNSAKIPCYIVVPLDKFMREHQVTLQELGYGRKHDRIVERDQPVHSPKGILMLAIENGEMKAEEKIDLYKRQNQGQDEVEYYLADDTASVGVPVDEVYLRELSNEDVRCCSPVSIKRAGSIQEPINIIPPAISMFSLEEEDNSRPDTLVECQTNSQNSNEQASQEENNMPELEEPKEIQSQSSLSKHSAEHSLASSNAHTTNQPQAVVQCCNNCPEVIIDDRDKVDNESYDEPSFQVDSSVTGSFQAESSINSKDLMMSINPSFVQKQTESTFNRYDAQALTRGLSEISEESPLQQILDTGRLRKKFGEIEKIGEGGFGKVYRGRYHVDRKQYAIKVVRLHILKSKEADPIIEIYQHRVYRELQAASRITSENIVRYFNSWFEELNNEEKLSELEYRSGYIAAMQSKHKEKAHRKIKASGSRSRCSKSSCSSNTTFLRQATKRKPSFGQSKQESKNLIVSALRVPKKEIIPEELNEDNEDEEIIIEKSKQTVTSSNEQQKGRKATSMIQSPSKYQRSRSSQKKNQLRSKRSEISKITKRSKQAKRSLSEQSRSSSSSSSSSSDESSESSSSQSSDPNPQPSLTESEGSNSSIGEDCSNFSQITLNNFLSRGQQYQSVNMMIQMEYCSGQSLENQIKKRNHKHEGTGFINGPGQSPGVIDREYNYQIFSQMINGMVEIHKNNVLHRDLKPENIFINQEQGHQAIAKIGDFGLARMLNGQNVQEQGNDSSQLSTDSNEYYNSPIGRQRGLTSTAISQFSTVAGTEGYMAPEIKTHFLNGTRPEKFANIEINKRQDIYQLGLILYEMSHKIKTAMQRTQLFRKLLQTRKLDEQCPIVKGKHVEFDLIMQMTEMDPTNRPSAETIQQEWLPKWQQQLQTNGWDSVGDSSPEKTRPMMTQKSLF